MLHRARACLGIGVAVAALSVGCKPGGGDERVACPPRFATEEWKATNAGAARQRLARQVVACRFVRRGDTKAQVAAVLGRAPRDELQYPGEYRLEWLYYVGETNGAMGPADGQNLSVRFTRAGRVRGLSVDP